MEREAARLLEGHAPPALLEGTKDIAELRRAQQRGHLWVALAVDQPVGFALVEMLEPDHPHLEEMDVHPAHGRKGIGSALLRTVCAWAAHSGYRQLTLVTFREVAWNMPFYARNGFVEVPMGSVGPALDAVVWRETERGLDPRGRVVMSYRTAGDSKLA